MAIHVPVLQKEVLECLGPKPNQNFIDCTVGEGGHSLAILKKNAPKGKVLGVEWDLEIYQNLWKQDFHGLETRLVLANDSFVNLKEIVKREDFKDVSGILFDLGMSSWHLEKSGRGFSFRKNEPLDMRYNPQNPLTAEKILNFWSKPAIEKILREYGEERFSKRIAEKIIEFRKLKPIKTTFQLVEIIKKAIPVWYQHKKIHFATRTFQSLRIAVNDELKNLQIALPQATEILEPGGRLAVISFHSLEDKIVKNFYRSRTGAQAELGRVEGGLESMDLKILTKKAIRPTKEEIINNPRSRSARLRAAIKTYE